MIWNYLKNAKKPILLYGMGNGADKILDRLLSLGITPDGVFASDGFARHNPFRGYTVISYSEALEKYGDFIALICFGSQRPEVLELFRSMRSRCELYAPDVPVYGDTVFDLAFARENKSRLKQVYDLLSDGLSKKAFEYTVRYKITGDIKYLFDCESGAAEAYKSIIRPQCGDSFLDIGAYTGDTVREFVSHCPDYGRIIAVEPDGKTYSKLCANTANLHNIELHNIAVYSEDTRLPFEKSGGRQSKIGASGDMITCRSVDGILGGGSVDYIKIDVEGFEREAILGARDTILRHKPKLCVSAYHRGEDYFAIPEAVLSIRDDYKLYMRHFPYVPAWDTSFYFV